MLLEEFLIIPWRLPNDNRLNNYTAFFPNNMPNTILIKTVELKIA